MLELYLSFNVTLQIGNDADALALLNIDVHRHVFRYWLRDSRDEPFLQVPFSTVVSLTSQTRGPNTFEFTHSANGGTERVLHKFATAQEREMVESLMDFLVKDPNRNPLLFEPVQVQLQGAAKLKRGKSKMARRDSVHLILVAGRLLMYRSEDDEVPRVAASLSQSESRKEGRKTLVLVTREVDAKGREVSYTLSFSSQEERDSWHSTLSIQRTKMAHMEASQPTNFVQFHGSLVNENELQIMLLCPDGSKRVLSTIEVSDDGATLDDIRQVRADIEDCPGDFVFLTGEDGMPVPSADEKTRTLRSFWPRVLIKETQPMALPADLPKPPQRKRNARNVEVPPPPADEPTVVRVVVQGTEEELAELEIESQDEAASLADVREALAGADLPFDFVFLSKDGSRRLTPQEEDSMTALDLAPTIVVAPAQEAPQEEEHKQEEPQELDILLEGESEPLASIDLAEDEDARLASLADVRLSLAEMERCPRRFRFVVDDKELSDEEETRVTCGSLQVVSIRAVSEPKRQLEIYVEGSGEVAGVVDLNEEDAQGATLEDVRAVASQLDKVPPNFVFRLRESGTLVERLRESATPATQCVPGGIEVLPDRQLRLVTSTGVVLDAVVDLNEAESQGATLADLRAVVAQLPNLPRNSRGEFAFLRPDEDDEKAVFEQEEEASVAATSLLPQAVLVEAPGRQVELRLDTGEVLCAIDVDDPESVDARVSDLRDAVRSAAGRLPQMPAHFVFVRTDDTAIEPADEANVLASDCVPALLIRAEPNRELEIVVEGENEVLACIDLNEPDARDGTLADVRAVAVASIPKLADAHDVAFVVPWQSEPLEQSDEAATPATRCLPRAVLRILQSDQTLHIYIEPPSGEDPRTGEPVASIDLGEPDAQGATLQVVRDVLESSRNELSQLSPPLPPRFVLVGATGEFAQEEESEVLASRCLPDLLVRAVSGVLQLQVEGQTAPVAEIDLDVEAPNASLADVRLACEGVPGLPATGFVFVNAVSETAVPESAEAVVSACDMLPRVLLRGKVLQSLEIVALEHGDVSRVLVNINLSEDELTQVTLADVRAAVSELADVRNGALGRGDGFVFVDVRADTEIERAKESTTLAGQMLPRLGVRQAEARALGGTLHVYLMEQCVPGTRAALTDAIGSIDIADEDAESATLADVRQVVLQLPQLHDQEETADFSFVVPTSLPEARAQAAVSHAEAVFDQGAVVDLSQESQVLAGDVIRVGAVLRVQIAPRQDTVLRVVREGETTPIGEIDLRAAGDVASVKLDQVRECVADEIGVDFVFLTADGVPIGKRQEKRYAAQQFLPVVLIRESVQSASKVSLPANLDIFIEGSSEPVASVEIPDTATSLASLRDVCAPLEESGALPAGGSFVFVHESKKVPRSAEALTSAASVLPRVSLRVLQSTVPSSLPEEETKSQPASTHEVHQEGTFREGCLYLRVKGEDRPLGLLDLSVKGGEKATLADVRKGARSMTNIPAHFLFVLASGAVVPRNREHTYNARAQIPQIDIIPSAAPEEEAAPAKSKAAAKSGSDDDVTVEVLRANGERKRVGRLRLKNPERIKLSQLRGVISKQMRRAPAQFAFLLQGRDAIGQAQESALNIVQTLVPNEKCILLQEGMPPASASATVAAAAGNTIAVALETAPGTPLSRVDVGTRAVPLSALRLRLQRLSGMPSEYSFVVNGRLMEDESNLVSAQATPTVLLRTRGTSARSSLTNDDDEIEVAVFLADSNTPIGEIDVESPGTTTLAEVREQIAEELEFDFNDFIFLKGGSVPITRKQEPKKKLSRVLAGTSRLTIRPIA